MEPPRASVLAPLKPGFRVMSHKYPAAHFLGVGKRQDRQKYQQRRHQRPRRDTLWKFDIHCPTLSGNWAW